MSTDHLTPPVADDIRAGLVPHPTVGERVARGKAARAAVPRSGHAELPLHDRADPVELLESQATSRVPELVPVRYGRMLVSPFTFYRGAALIMASDLARTPNSGIRTQVCGDAHLANFGAFASPERKLVFDLNDFDETLPGPWEWDVKRMCASFVIAARDRGFTEAEQRAIVCNAASKYREAMRDFAGMRDLDVWYAHLDVDQLLQEYGAQFDPKARRRTEKNIAKARTRDSMQAFEKLTTEVNGERRIVSDPPLIVPIEELYPDVEVTHLTEELHKMLRGYRRSLQHDRRHLLEQFRFVQIARKVVGVGSVGTRAFVMLLLGRDDSDPLFLQAKEAQASVLEPFVGTSEFGSHAQRVVVGQRLMQAVTDIFLGFERVQGFDGVERDFYVRQLRDWKGSANLEQMLPQGMMAYGSMCAWTLARAHARSGDRIAIAAYLGTGNVFDNAIADFSIAYADLNERDYDTFKQAVESGRITAQTGL